MSVTRMSLPCTLTLRSDVRQQCLELAVIQGTEEGGVNDLHHNRHDIAHETGIVLAGV